MQERARELRLWYGLELKLRRWQDRVADEYEQIGKEACAARIGEDYAAYREKAEAARERAEERRRQKQSIHEYYHTKAALARAMARLKTRRE